MNICADCLRFMGCCWEREFKPVPGWTAKPAEMKIRDKKSVKILQTWDVFDCPLFVAPGPEYKRTEKPQITAKRIRAVHEESGRELVFSSIREAKRYRFPYITVRRCLAGELDGWEGWRFTAEDPPSVCNETIEP